MKLVPVKPKVTLLAYTQLENNKNSEAIVSAAAKLCYSNSSAEELLDHLDDATVEKFLTKLSSMGHQSPIEHLSFTFGVEGISRACSHQLVRHRIASYNQQSQRYVDLRNNDECRYIIPDEIEQDKNLLKKFNQSVKEAFENYSNLTDMLEKDYINNQELTKKELNAIRKKALENARSLLPNACETKIMITMNARTLYHFFDVRCCNRAQEEIREVANQMLKIVKQKAPNIFKQAGAPCVRGKCPEGIMSCGKPQQRPIQ